MESKCSNRRCASPHYTSPSTRVCPDHLAQIFETTINADRASIQVSNQPRGGETALRTLKGRNLQQLGLKCVQRH